jgi:predicted Zn-dependent peptidase
MIVYYITGLDEYVNLFKYEMLDAILNKFNISKYDFEKELNIIREEYFYSFSDSNNAHYYNTLRKYFNYYNPIGDLDAINNITYEQMLDLYKRQYSTPYMIINVSKNSDNFDTKRIEDLLNKQSELILTEPIFKLNENYKHQKYNKNDNHTNILNIGKKLNENDKPYLSIINKMLAGDLKKPLYKIIREEKSLCYYVGLDNISFDKDNYPFFYTETSDENISKINDLFIEILSNPEKHLNEKIFNDVILYFKTKSKMKDINIYNNIEKYFSYNIFSDNVLDNLKFNDVMDFYNNTYKNASEFFTLTNNKI